MNRQLLFITSLLLIGGCATAPQQAPVKSPAPVYAPALAPATPPSHMVYRPDAADTITGIRTALYEQHDEWQGTPYRIGGLSKRGIDCSGFVFTTLQSRFGIEVPRTARAQSRLGEAVALEEMQPGDLVFFRNNRSRTGWHVGIYVENRQFLHASTSQGVILSSLEEPYWRSTFQQARRLPFDY